MMPDELNVLKRQQEGTGAPRVSMESQLSAEEQVPRLHPAKHEAFARCAARLADVTPPEDWIQNIRLQSNSFLKWKTFHPLQRLHSPWLICYHQSMFVPLLVKSEYSLAYGTASIDELVERAAALGYKSLALTDLENLYGQVQFHQKCRLHGIHPITGIELRPGFAGRHSPGSRSGRLILIALDDRGYRSLCRIVSRRRGRSKRGDKAGCGDPLPLAEQHSEGLIILSDDISVIERLVQGGRFSRERIGLLMVRPDSAAADIAETAGRLQVRLVADLDAVFLDLDDHPLHVLQVAIGKGQLLDLTARGGDVESAERRLRSAEEAAALFADLPDALAAAEDIAAQCRLELGSDEETAHVYNPEAGSGDAEKLRRLCQEALAELKLSGRLEYRRRLEEELEVFAGLNFSGFMLIVADILGHCRSHGILVAVRGSAVSSLVLHLLGSPVDPIAHGLLFERFLHRGKTAWPDVDIDLPWDRRDEVIDWVYRRFGKEKVAMVAAIHTFRYRSALREGLKAWGAPESLIESMSRQLPPEDLAPEEVDFLDLSAASAEAAVGDDSVIQDTVPPQLRNFLPLIRRLVGRPRHLAVHPGGIVIDWRPLEDLLPLELAPKGVVVTQYDLVAVAKLGLVKIDLLGNRCLSEIEETLDAAGWPKPLRLQSIPHEDPATLELIDRAQTVGCFQLESPAMRSLLARLPIRRQSDLIAALALIRPGAAAGEVKNTFIRRARGEEKKTVDLPVLTDRLRETHGLPIYEEDIMLLLSRSGGVSLAQADELRRGIVKSGGDAALLSSLQTRFLTRAGSNFPNDRSALARARRSWQVAARFAAYSFSKAHAASYALLAYYSAYLKIHHPVEFACALLNHHQGLYPLRVEAAELRRLGVRLLPPHVNDSEYHSRIVETENGAGERPVRVGLDKVKSLSRRAALEMVAERKARGPFVSLRDLLDRVRLGVHEVAALLLSGSCDGLPPLRAADYPFVHEVAVERLRQKCDLSELENLRVVTQTPDSAAERERVRKFQALVRVRNELNYLEMHLSAHPMELLREEAKQAGCVTVSQTVATPSGSSVRLAAVVAAMRRVMTKQGPLQFITFEDETGLLEAVVYPVVYRQLGERVTTPGPFLVEGKVRDQQGAVHLEVGRLKPFREAVEKLRS
jgi:DNA-directed DNA polymerase III PolC